VEDPEFFETAWAAGIYASGLLQPGVDELPDGAVNQTVSPEESNKFGHLSAEKESLISTNQSHNVTP